MVMLNGMGGNCWHLFSSCLTLNCHQNNLTRSLLDLSRCVLVVFVLESLFQVVSHKCWIEINSHFPWCAVCFDFDAQIAVGLGMNVSLVHTGLVHQDPHSI